MHFIKNVSINQDKLLDTIIINYWKYQQHHTFEDNIKRCLHNYKTQCVKIIHIYSHVEYARVNPIQGIEALAQLKDYVRVPDALEYGPLLSLPSEPLKTLRSSNSR